MTIFTFNNYNTQNCINFLQSIFRTSPSPENLYFFFGKTDAWDSADTTPELSNDTISAQKDIRDNMYGIKKITISDVALLARKIEWQSGTVYDEYSSTDSTLSTKNFYVITDNNNVYKCIDNNDGGQSSVKPSGTSTSIFTTGDSYQWKFLFNITSSQASKFSTDNYIPIPFSTQKSLEQIAVEEASSYTLNSPFEGHGSNIPQELFCDKFMIYASINGDEAGTFSTSIEFRQNGLIINPKDTSGDLLTNSVYTCNDSNSSVDTNSGQILVAENRAKISRSAAQNDIFRFVVDF